MDIKTIKRDYLVPFLKSKTVTYKAAIIAIATAVGLSSYFLTGKADGTIENIAETVLRTQGIDIDLSPNE